MAVTRIKNNQITDATITAAKIASQTLVGSLFATDLTLNSNLSVIGNLTVTGTSSNINAINTYITDPFVIFNNGYAGSLTDYTIGMLVNRNLASLNDFGSVNTAWVWAEADQAFTGIATTDTGSGIVSINNSGYANIKIGNLNAVTNITASSLTAASINLTDAGITTLVATNFSTANAVISGGYISALTNASITTGNVTSWYAFSLNSTNGNIINLNNDNITSVTVNATNGNIFALDNDHLTSHTVNVTNGNIFALDNDHLTSYTVNATNGNIVALNSGTVTTFTLNTTNGNITNLSSLTLVATNFSTGNAVISGGTVDNTVIGSITPNAGTFTTANATTVNGTTVNAGTTTTATLNTTTGNVGTLDVTTTTTATLNTTNGNITNASATTLVATNFSTGNARIAGGYADNFPIGANTKATGAFTTLDATGAINFTNATQSDNPSTGALIVTGGVGVGANLNVGGNVTVTGNLTVLGTTTAIDSQTLDVVDLNITVAKGSPSAAAANGAGLTVDGANATLTYLNADDSWNLNKKLNVPTIEATTTTTATLNTTNGNITNGSATTLVATNFSTGNAVIAGGSINGTIIGNTTTAAASFTTATATTVNGTTVNAGTTTSATVNATTGNVGTLDVTTTTTATLNTTNGNITNGSSTTLVATNFSTGNAVVTGGSLNNTVIGASTAEAATFTRLRATGNILADSDATSTTYTTGAIVVPNNGGVGIGGNLHVRGESEFTGNITAGNVVVTGNINVSVGAVASSYGVFYGNPTTGENALFAGKPGYTPLGNVILQMTADINHYAQVNFQNLNTGPEASGDFVITADNGNDTMNYIDLGIGSSTYNFAGYSGYYPNDGYLLIDGGNLLLNVETPEKMLRCIVGSYDEADLVFYASNSNVHIVKTTASTSVSEGALIVDGGTGIGGNLNVGKSAIINTTKSAGYDFVVKGYTDETLIWARPSATYDQVVIGDSATTSTLVNGAKLIVTGTDSMMIPAGSTGQRPGSVGGTDTPGMIRFNTSNAQLEFYNGSAWTNTGTSFTVVASETFDGDDSTVDFTLGAAATTQSVIVSINGIVQIPSIAYSVGGVGSNVLTFTQAPASGDKIEVRRLSTTATVSTLESGNGFVSFVANDNFANIYSGTASDTLRMSVDTAGTTTIFGNLIIDGNTLQEKAYYERFANVSNTGGNLTCDFAEGGTFYAGSLTANVTANFTNIISLPGTAVGVTLIVDQGGAAYGVSNIQINGGPVQSVKWAGGVGPNVGTAGNTDVMSFSLLNLDGTNYRILGAISNYG